MITPRHVGKTAVAAVPLLVSCAAATVAGEVFRRAEALEEIVGRVEVRRSFGAALEVVVECGERPAGCREERTYGDLIELEFWLRRQETRDSSVTSSEDPAGGILLAADFEDADRESFLAELEAALTALPATAFDLPLAGLGPSRPPFDKGTLAHRSFEPTWVCFRTGSGTKVVRYHRRNDGDEVVGVGAKHYGNAPTDLCDQIRTRTRTAYPESFWTLSSPRRLLERVVDHEEVVRLGDDPRSLTDRPDGVQLVKQKMTIDAAIDSAAVDEGGLSRATHASNGWRFDAWAPPAAMPVAALDENAWLQAWRIRSVEREFGADPESRVVGDITLYAAFLATLPAARLASPAADGSYRVSSTGHLESELVVAAAGSAPGIDRGVFVEQVIADLEANAGDPRDPIERMLLRPFVGLTSEGWIAVVCSPDGSASYSLPPTRASNAVTNADIFCGALESRLPGPGLE
ncbi:MAG TPA: hypothetical protein VD788_16200 [Candidatus Polarisedimenticolaceae bacterium]|nr:hypothetical protein [Candidatus Polarisedimenticolaceae bacterium]